MNDYLNAHYDEPTLEFPEVSRRTSVIAFFLGMAVIAAPVFTGRSYVFYGAFLVFSLCMTFLWRKTPRPWILLVSIVAAAPIPLMRQQFACNLVCAFWFILFNREYLSRLPRWIYFVTGLALLGLFTSSIEWIGDNFIGSMMRQGALAYNFLLAPFVLIPLIYCRMEKSNDSIANLQGLLFGLIIPTTLLLFLAKLFGSVTNAWEASLHVGAGAEGYLQYQFGKVIFSFQRTEIGFVLAALICASTAITVSPVKFIYRLMGGACLASNAFLLLTTGSFGSGTACLCGLVVIFYSQLQLKNMGKWLMSLAAFVCLLFLMYTLIPQNIKIYLAKRYEHRVVKADKDRVELWKLALDYHLEHPLGVGFTFLVGDKEKTYIHNDYLAYTVSYSILGGMAYISLVAGLINSFFKRRKDVIDDPSALAVYLAGLGVVIAIAVNSITDNMGSSRWYFNVIWSLIWYSYFCSRAEHNEIFLEGTERETYP
jgi:uncharacterized membrane protein YagU involved in acid resistance